MPTTTDERTLLAAIADDPADDTVRLVYADWLTETEEPERMARAELIRVQCELAQIGPRPPSCNRTTKKIGRGCPGCMPEILWQDKTTGLRRREAALLRKYPKWQQVTCPACEGQGYLEWSAEDGGSPPMKCPFCPTKNRTVGTGHLPVTLRRGFEHRVTVPRLEQVGAERDGMICRRCNYWAPVDDVASRCDVCRKAYHPYDDAEIRFRSTDHARNLMAALPTVQELVPGDKTPRCSARRPGEWYWTEGGVGEEYLPTSLFRLMGGCIVSDQSAFNYHPTDSAAISALGVTLAALVRG